MTVCGTQQEEQECHFRLGHMDNMTHTSPEDNREKERVRGALRLSSRSTFLSRTARTPESARTP